MIAEGICLVAGGALTWYFAIPGKTEELKKRQRMHEQINQEQKESHRKYNSYFELLHAKLHGTVDAQQQFTRTAHLAHQEILHSLEASTKDVKNSTAKIQKSIQPSLSCEQKLQGAATRLNQTIDLLSEQIQESTMCADFSNMAALKDENKRLKHALGALLKEHERLRAAHTKLQEQHQAPSLTLFTCS